MVRRHPAHRGFGTAQGTSSCRYLASDRDNTACTNHTPGEEGSSTTRLNAESDGRGREGERKRGTRESTTLGAEGSSRANGWRSFALGKLAARTQSRVHCQNAGQCIALMYIDIYTARVGSRGPGRAAVARQVFHPLPKVTPPDPSHRAAPKLLAISTPLACLHDI
jgi:hypothetical protein